MNLSFFPSNQMYNNACYRLFSEATETTQCFASSSLLGSGASEDFLCRLSIKHAPHLLHSCDGGRSSVENCTHYKTLLRCVQAAELRRRLFPDDSPTTVGLFLQV